MLDILYKTQVADLIELPLLLNAVGLWPPRIKISTNWSLNNLSRPISHN